MQCIGNQAMILQAGFGFKFRLFEVLGFRLWALGFYRFWVLDFGL
jgi:hypothetical protein